MYVSIHDHTDGSILDGMSKIKDLVAKAASFGMPALGITDHGNMIKTYEFQLECEKNNIKPIIGCEFYMGNDDNKATNHILCIARTQEGLTNLLKLQELSGYNFYKKPRIKLTDLIQHREGLIITTACMGSIFGDIYKTGSFTRLCEELNKYNDLFAPYFYVEIQPHDNHDVQKYSKALYKAAKPLNIPMICSNDVHYVNPEDKQAHEVMLAAQTKTTIYDSNRFRFNGSTYYLMNKEEMRNRLIDMGITHSFTSDDVTHIMNNTMMIADMCNARFEKGDYQPKFNNMNNDESTIVLKNMCIAGLILKKLNNEKYKKRLNYELDVINQKGYSGYFLIVADLIDFCKKNGIPVGVGRGSAAGALTAYSLNITDIDPIEHGLLFERFLNPERNSAPDIDIDFDDQRRGEVVQYIVNKYGVKNTAQIMAEADMTKNSVIRRVLSAYGFTGQQMNRISAVVNSCLAKTVADLEDCPEFERLIGTEITREQFEIMKKLEGNMDHESKHAAGVVIAPKPIAEIIPCMYDRSIDALKTQWDKKTIESLGIYKFDILGLKTLSLIRIAMENARIDKLPTLKEMNDEKEIYSIFHSRDLCGIFQFDTPTGRKMFDKIKPMDFSEIVTATSIVRPGVKEANLYLQNYNEYKQTGRYNKTGNTVVDETLSETYGAIIYQEQTMLLMNRMAGWSLGKTDKMRKVKNLEEFRDDFVNNSIANGFASVLANQIYNRFSLEYSFNKSHAVSYSAITIITAWLKYHYRAAFMAALMTIESAKTDNDLVQQIKECQKYGITVLSPTSQYIGFEFKYIDEHTIQMPLITIRSISGCVDNLTPGMTMLQTYEKVNIAQIINMIKVGCFDWEHNRRYILLRILLEKALLESKVKKQKERLQEEINNIVNNLNNVEKLYVDWEQELLGININYHPLKNMPVVNFENIKQNEHIEMTVLVQKIKEFKDKRKRDMAFITVETLYQTIDCVIFSNIYNQIKQYLQQNNVIHISGRKDGEKILIDNIRS